MGAFRIPSNLVHGDVFSLQSCLLGGIAKVGDRHTVFLAAAVCEVDGIGDVVFQVFPFYNQFFVQRVELIRIWKTVLQPVPLRHRGLNQACWGISVVFQQLDGGAVVSQVKPP